MEITTLLIASETSTIKGRLYVTGGGYARHDVDHLPSTVVLHVGATVMAEPGEPFGDPVLEAGVLGPDGGAVPGDGVRLPVAVPDGDQLPPEVPAVAGLAFPLSFRAVAAGTHRLVVRVTDAGTSAGTGAGTGTALERSLPFGVLVSPPRADDPRP